MQSIPEILEKDGILIVNNTLLVDGMERNYMELSEDELKRVKSMIKPRLKSYTNISDENHAFLFFLFKVYYQREYQNVAEEEERFNIFETNLGKINKINSGDRSFKAAINKFADRRDDELPLGLRSSPKSDSSSNEDSKVSKMDKNMKEVQKENNLTKPISNAKMSEPLKKNETISKSSPENDSNSKPMCYKIIE